MRKALSILLLISGLVLLSVGLSPLAGAAQTNVSTGVTVTFHILSHQVISVDTATVDFGNVWPEMSPLPTHDVTITVKSNIPWTLSYTAPAEFTDGGTPAKTVPIGSLSYDGTAFVSGLHEVGAGAGRTSGTTFDYTYTLDVPWTAEPETTYSGIITYTLAPAS